MARVLRVITRLNIGGPARQALLLTDRLREEHPTRLLAGDAPAKEGELDFAGVPVERVPLVRSINPVADMQAVTTIRQHIRSHEAAIVHTHMAKAGATGRLAASSVSPRPRTVHTFHGHVLSGYFQRWAEQAFLLAERALARRTDVLIAISEQVRDDLLELGVGQPEQYRVVPLGLDLAPQLALGGPSGELRSSLEIGPDVPLIGVLGRLAPIKDHATLFRAVALVPDVHLAVLGDGETRGDLHRLAEQLGIADRVHFAGWWLDVTSALADMDVVVLTSRNEGTPVSLIEAQAAAIPTIATDVGGVRAVVLDGVTGTVVPPQQPEAVAIALERILGDAELRRAMGRRGRAHVRARFDIARLVDDLRDLYTELAG